MKKKKKKKNQEAKIHVPYSQDIKEDTNEEMHISFLFLIYLYLRGCFLILYNTHGQDERSLLSGKKKSNSI